MKDLTKVYYLKRSIVLITVLAAITFILRTSSVVTSAASEPGVSVQTASPMFANPDDEMACASCHEQVVREFGKTAHGKAPDKWDIGIKKTGEYASASTCIACHGDPTEHIANGGDPTKIKNPAKMSQRESVQSCQSCHSQINEHAQFRGSRHESAGLTCVNCHSPHHAAGVKGQGGGVAGLSFASLPAETKLLRYSSVSETCMSCHSDVRKSMFQRSTHLFRNEDREQKMSCSTCHEPHGSVGEKMMRTATVNETCYTCHAEFRGPVLWDHAPVRENCANCHKPHGSNNLSLLKQRAPMLCQQCHIQGRHQTVPGRPNSGFNFNRSCLNCHSQVHGSNHPSGINLQR